MSTKKFIKVSYECYCSDIESFDYLFEYIGQDNNPEKILQSYFDDYRNYANSIIDNHKKFVKEFCLKHENEYFNTDKLQEALAISHDAGLEFNSSENLRWDRDIEEYLKKNNVQTEYIDFDVFLKEKTNEFNLFQFDELELY